MGLMMGIISRGLGNPHEYSLVGGRGGIRTRGGFNPTYAFQAYDLNRSSTLPNQNADCISDKSTLYGTNAKNRLGLTNQENVST